jgi:anti-sigma regulatory factor (Ser/Thr protein kinase)
MEILQIIVLFALFYLSFIGYKYFNRIIIKSRTWIKHNLIFLSFGIIAAIAFTPFAYPYNVWKNIPVFTIIPLSALNFFYILTLLLGDKRISVIIKEILEICAILLGSFVGIMIINMLRIGVFMQEDIEVTLLIAFLFSVARLLDHYAQLEKANRRNKATLKGSKIKEIQIQHQLEVLQAKLSPHFLYNSLNSIASLALIDGQRTKDMTIALSKLLRFSLIYSENNFTTIEKEIEILEAYLEVEKIRFEENLKYEIDVSEEAGEYIIPGFILQPIVENCIKHAFINSESFNFISVVIRIVRNEIEITIGDNGVLFPDKIMPGYGFKNVNDKLQLLFPGKYDFEIGNRPEKQVKIVIRELKMRNEQTG